MVVELVVLETDLGGVFEVAEVALPGLLRLVPGGDVVLNVHEGVPAVLAHCPTRLLVQLKKSNQRNHAINKRETSGLQKNRILILTC